MKFQRYPLPEDSLTMQSTVTLGTDEAMELGIKLITAAHKGDPVGFMWSSTDPWRERVVLVIDNSKEIA